MRAMRPSLSAPTATTARAHARPTLAVRRAPCDVREGADEERIQAGSIEEDALGFFRDRRAHVVRGSAGTSADGFGERRDFSEAADGDRCRERGQNGGDFEAQVEAGIRLGDAADRTVASA